MMAQPTVASPWTKLSRVVLPEVPLPNNRARRHQPQCRIIDPCGQAPKSVLLPAKSVGSQHDALRGSAELPCLKARCRRNQCWKYDR
jgi:hypothetical protein